MSEPHRILIVDDEEDTLFTVRTALEMEGFDVHTAANLRDAQTTSKRYLFHVAMVDIMLAGPKNSDRSGFKVIEFIRSLGEGTRCIAISAFREADVPAEAANRHVDHYIMKKSITSPTIYIREIRRLAQEYEPSFFGHFKTIAEYVAGPADPRIWETQVVSALRSDVKTFRSLLERATRNLLPIIPSMSESASLILNKDPAHLEGKYWSKSIGGAVKVTVYNRANGMSERVKGETETFQSGTLGIDVQILAGLDRDSFLMSTFDVKRPAGPSR